MRTNREHVDAARFAVDGTRRRDVYGAQLGLRVSFEMMRRLQEIADLEGISVATLVRRLVELELERRDEAEALRAPESLRPGLEPDS